MLNTEEKLQNLLNSSLQSTKSEIAHTLSAYIRTLDEEYSDHCQKARVRAEHEVELESERLTREGNRSLAEEQLHLRRRIRREEEDLTARLFEEVEDRLEAYMATPAYKELLLSQIQSAAAFAVHAAFVSSAAVIPRAAFGRKHRRIAHTRGCDQDGIIRQRKAGSIGGAVRLIRIADDNPHALLRSWQYMME